MGHGLHLVAEALLGGNGAGHRVAGLPVGLRSRAGRVAQNHRNLVGAVGHEVVARRQRTRHHAGQAVGGIHAAPGIGPVVLHEGGS